METVNAETTKNKKPTMLWFGIGTLVLGTLAFLGIKNLKKEKNDKTNQTTTDLDSKISVQNNSIHKPRTGLRPDNDNTAFPLRLGAKGDKVRLLQQSLIRTYGASILPKHGANGQFGNELESALRSKGYAVPLSESDFSRITQKKEEQTPKKQAPLLSYDNATVAKGIYFSIIGKDFNAAITLLKSIRNTNNYSLVNEKFKNYRINGVRQTLVNGLLKRFSEGNQKLKIQDALKNIGLKFDGNKWTLS